MLVSKHLELLKMHVRIDKIDKVSALKKKNKGKCPNKKKEFPSEQGVPIFSLGP